MEGKQGKGGGGSGVERSHRQSMYVCECDIKEEIQFSKRESDTERTHSN